VLGFKICFTYPWLLLVLIPILIFAFVPYFKINKRYRRTRNRIISLVLHCIVAVLSVSLLAGFHVEYVVPNEENELILLVDVSDTENESAVRRDAFVKSVIKDCYYDNIKVGVVTFGFDQVYAAELSFDTDKVVEDYVNATMPDVSATNIASALEYTSTLFNYPKTGKIVLVTDGKETDEDALLSVSTITASGITVDSAYVPSTYGGTDAQITAITLPNQYVEIGKEYEIAVDLNSDASISATLVLSDNGDVNTTLGTKTVQLTEGLNHFIFKHCFNEEGLHEIRFELQLDDAINYNNSYSTYFNLQIFNDVLIIERVADSSQALIDLLNGDDANAYKITTVQVDGELLPKSTNELRLYDQIILNNVAYCDMPNGFDAFLESYVKDFGGGLFTIGGNDDNGKSHAYNRSNEKNQYGSIYRDLLPVELIDYTPPIAVMILIDSSGSMGSNSDYGGTFFDSAKAGALACLDVLYDRDYVGVMTLDTDQALILPLTPRTQETKIKEAISGIKADYGNTVFASAINSAGAHLRDQKDVAKRHIVVITDGMAGEPSTYESIIKNYYETDGITFSVIGVGMVEQEAIDAMESAVAIGHGRLYQAINTKELIESVKSDLQAPKIQDVNNSAFKPIVYNNTSPLIQDLDRGEGTERNRLTVNLGGFYGTRKKENSDVILVGDYEVPLYVQWQYGKGYVGSFMCDLQSSAWSSEFMADKNGQKFIKNVVNNLMPRESIRAQELEVSLTEDNYINTLSVFANLNKDEYITGELVQIKSTGSKMVSLNEPTPTQDSSTTTFYILSELSANNKYSRCSFIVKESGVYAIKLTKFSANGEQIGDTFVLYKAFSYSEEYDKNLFVDEKALTDFLENLTEKGNGTILYDLDTTDSVFEGFLLELVKTFDPRWLFMILAIVFFLLDVAVTKFKFKWIHEIIRDKKRRK